MDWNDFIAETGARTDAIWMEEPSDLRRLRNGIVDSGAGTYGQAFMALLFVQSETRGLTLNACQAVLVCAADEASTLDQLKLDARAHLAGRSGLLDYMGAHELGGLFKRFLAALDTIDSKETFVRVLRALKTYGVRFHAWTCWSFPWHLGMGLGRVTADGAEALRESASQTRWTPTAYMGR